MTAHTTRLGISFAKSMKSTWSPSDASSNTSRTTWRTSRSRRGTSAGPNDLASTRFSWVCAGGSDTMSMRWDTAATASALPPRCIPNRELNVSWSA